MLTIQGGPITSPQSRPTAEPLGVCRSAELSVEATERSGPLREALAALSGQGVTVLAQSPAHNRAATRFRLVVDDTARADASLQEAGFKCQVEPVVLVEWPLRPALMAQFENYLAEAAIDTLQSFASWDGGGTLVGVFQTTDDERAVGLLRGLMTEANHGSTRAEPVASGVRAAVSAA